MSHLNEKIDYTVTAYIVYEGKVLLRLHDKYKRWFGCGGHIELHEGPIEAVIREAKEETGLDIEIISQEQKQYKDNSIDLPLPMMLNRHSINETHEHVDFMYAARALHNNIDPAPGEEIDPNSFRWFSKEELATFEELEDRVRNHAIKALELNLISQY